MMTMMLGRASEAVVEISSRRSAPMSRMDAEEASGGEQAGQRFDLAPAFALFDLLDAEVVEVIVEHRGAFLRKRRSAIVLLLPHRHAVLSDARLLQRGRERRAERAQRHELGARQTLAELFEPPVFRNRGNQVERHDRSHTQIGLPSLQYGITAHFRHSRPARRHTSPSRGGPNAAVSVASGWATTHRPSGQSRPIAGLGALPIKTGMKSFQDRSRKGRNTLVLKLFFSIRGRNLRNEPAFLCRATNVPCLAVSVRV